MEIKQIEINENLCLTLVELAFFYKLLLVCETKNLKGFNFIDKRLQKFIKDNNIILSYNKKGEKWNRITRESERNEIQFCNTQYNSICANLFLHLRNAFAHGYIEKDKETKTLHFQNIYNNGECKIKMDGKMRFKTLKELVEIILETQKKEEQNEKENL